MTSDKQKFLNRKIQSAIAHTDNLNFIRLNEVKVKLKIWQLSRNNSMTPILKDTFTIVLAVSPYEVLKTSAKAF